MEQTLYIIDVLNDDVVDVRHQIQQLFEREGVSPPHQYINGVNESHQLLDILNNSPVGVIISGSVHSTYEQLPWMQDLEEFVRHAHQRELPVLGICFGHQIIASALGGRVERMPMREFGTHPVYLKPTIAHPYLEGFNSGTIATLTHQDHVAELPPGAEPLGFSPLTENQIFSVGSCFGVQFHPEYDAHSLRALAKVRRKKFLEERLFNSDIHLDHYLETMPLTHETGIIVTNFLKSIGAL